MQPIFIKEFLPPNVLGLVYQYCLMKFSKKSENFELGENAVLISEYSDYLMETLLDISTPVIEKNVNKKLWPTYSFFRIYDRESDLPVHKDRGSCEYSVALCLGAQPHDKPYEIFIGERDDTSDYKYYDDDGRYNRYKINHKFAMLPNNALIFQGMDADHWREKCDHDHFITVFLHYVEQEGKHKDYKFDKRKTLAGPPNKIGK